MALTTDPAVNSWVLVSRLGESLWLKVVSAANGTAMVQVMSAPLAWPNSQNDVVPVNYSEVLSTAAPGATPVQPDVLAGDPPPGGTTRA
jgi:hypothetical protein